MAHTLRQKIRKTPRQPEKNSLELTQIAKQDTF